MAAKGLTKAGGAYCLICQQTVDADAAKCPTCDEEFTETVRAFPCPRCDTVIALGTAECPKCGMRFKVKTLRQRVQGGDEEKVLMKLIEWGKTPRPEEPSKSAPEPPTVVQEKPHYSPEQLAKLSQLKAAIQEIVSNRSQMLLRMQKRLEEEKKRLATLSETEGRSPTVEQVEAEVMSLADEVADFTMLEAHMEAISDELASLMDSFELSEEARTRGLAARALKLKLDEKERELGEIKAREEQLEKREQMVDRKIKAYAQKKKELDEVEENLKAKLAKLEEERAELERIRVSASGASQAEEIEAVRSKWKEEQGRLREQLVGLRLMVAPARGDDESVSEEIIHAEADLDSAIKSLESRLKDLLAEKSELDKKLEEASMFEEELRRLLKVLDELLGELPEKVIARFSNSEDYALYERVLDRLRI